MDYAIREPAQPEMQEQVLRLTQEKRELQDYAERVTRELRRYQQARPTPPDRPEDDMPLPPWATNMQMMSPLLFAYEERIAELETVVERSVSLAEQAQVLTQENDALRAELQERTEQLRNAQMLVPFRDGQDGEQPDELQELYRLSVEQNEALAQQNQLLKLQVERMQQTLGATQQQAQTLQAQLQQGTQAHEAETQRAVRAFTEERSTSAKLLQDEQERCQTLSRQKAAAEQRLEEITAELVEEVRAREALQGDAESLQQDLQMQLQSLDFYKKSYEDRCLLAAEEEERLQTELDRVAHSERGFRQRTAHLERELSEVSDALGAARREGEVTRREAEQMLRLMESIEKRLRDISAKHEKAQRDIAEKDGELRELHIQRDGLAATEQELRRKLERQEARLSSELETIKRQRETEGSQLEQTHRRAVSELEEQLRKSEQSVTQLRGTVELLERQKTWESSACERQSSAYTMEREQLRTDLDQVQQERLLLERQVETSRKETVRLRQELEAAAARARDAASRAVNDSAAAQAKILAEERTVRLVKDELKTCEGRVQSAASDHSRLQGELQHERARAADLVEAERQKAVQERRGLERQLQSVQSKERQEKQLAVQLLQTAEVLNQRLQSELATEKEHFESQLDRLRRQNDSLRKKSHAVLREVAQQRAAETDQF